MLKTIENAARFKQTGSFAEVRREFCGRRLPAFLLAISAGLLAQGASKAADRPCGPPVYCARTDERVEPYPKSPPVLGEAGTRIVDPNFGSSILRVTDRTSEQSQPGQSFHTPSASYQNSWNSQTTRFYIDEVGGEYLLFDFDAKTMTARRHALPDLGWRGEPQFSYVNADLLYGTARRPSFQQFDISSGKITTLHDPGDCLKLEGSISAFALSLSGDDGRLAAVVGPKQDENFIIYVYDKKQGCRWYNTESGEIGGQWGVRGTVASPERFPMHDARLSMSGKFVYATRGGGVDERVVWEVDTLRIASCRPGPQQCSGHPALGYEHVLNPSGRNHPMDILVRPYSRLEDFSRLLPRLPRSSVWYDKHISWNNVNPQDTNPACLSTYRRDNPTAVGAPLAVDGAWENEIDCLETDGRGSRIWRFAHTYSTASNGFWSTPRGNVSQDGKFYMFTSDWENELGAALSGRGYRTDVFIVELH